MTTKYERIIRVACCVDDHCDEQSDLIALAGRVGLSLPEFHGLFSGWAGMSPRDFLRGLTASHVKGLLRKGEIEPGVAPRMSGPMRLPALDVSLEDVAPGEMIPKDEGWLIRVGFADSPFGRCLIGECPRGVCCLSFIESGDGQAEWEAMRKDWPRSRVQRDDSIAAGLADRVFERSVHAQSHPPLRAFVKGTAFQVRVWRALLRVGPGELVSYKQLASALSNPGAARAVGTAVGRNPLAYLIPCHRVVRETGVIGDYRWGHIRKRVMVAWESVVYSSVIARGRSFAVAAC